MWKKLQCFTKDVSSRPKYHFYRAGARKRFQAIYPCGNIRSSNVKEQKHIPALYKKGWMLIWKVHTNWFFPIFFLTSWRSCCWLLPTCPRASTHTKTESTVIAVATKACTYGRSDQWPRWATICCKILVYSDSLVWCDAFWNSFFTYSSFNKPPGLFSLFQAVK